MKRHIQDRFAFGGFHWALRSGLIERHREKKGVREKGVLIGYLLYTSITWNTDK